MSVPRIRCKADLFISLLLVIFVQSHPVRAQFEAQEKVPLTLFQITARADLVVHARVVDGEAKRAFVEVIEALRGTPPATTLRIDFRDLNIERAGKEIVTFTAGEEYILFLERPNWIKPKEKYADIFALYHGRRGRMLLPAEGTGIPVDAVRELAALVRRPPDEQVSGLRALVLRDNPVLREAALDEIARLGAASLDDLSALLTLLRDPDPKIRSHSLRLLRGVLVQRGSEEAETEKRTALETCRERARNDPVPAVRVEAVRVLGGWPAQADVLTDLKTIATADASQDVRYEAQRIMYRWGVRFSAEKP